NLASVGLPESSPKLALKFSKFVEYSHQKLQGYDHFPMREALRAISKFHFGTSFAVITAWHHRYILELSDMILPVLQEGVVSNKLSPRVGSSLLPINTDQWERYVEINKEFID